MYVGLLALYGICEEDDRMLTLYKAVSDQLVGHYIDKKKKKPTCSLPSLSLYVLLKYPQQKDIFDFLRLQSNG